jgi:hypothetical protein
MPEKTNRAAETTFAEDGKRALQELHDRGVIDLDAPMRQLLDRMDAPGDVQGYEFTTGPEADQWWVYVTIEPDSQGGTKGRVLMGSDLKEDGTPRR